MDHKIEEHDLEENMWIHGKPVANLPSSEISMSEERKTFIRKALEFEIIDIRSYTGYKGDLIIEVTTMDPHAVAPLKQTAESLGMETASTKDILFIHKIYCITPVTNAYDLKED
jgi:hypothetical protein